MVGRPQDWGLYLLGYICETICAANAERVRSEDPKGPNDPNGLKQYFGKKWIKWLIIN